MAEPERDDRGVDAGVQQAHRGGVAQDVRGDPFGSKRWACLCRSGGMLGQAVLERVAAERRAGAGRKQRVAGLAVALAQPCPQDRGRARGQRCDAVLSSFAQAADVGAVSEVDV